MSWKNRFQRSSAHTQANIVCTVLIMVATIAYSIIAGRQLTKMSGQLDSMNRTYDEIHKQTKAAQWSEYMACLNAQATQATFIQSQNSARDSHAATIATVEQTAAGIEAQRAIINFLPRTPAASDQVGSNLSVPFSIKNEGKSDARNVHLRFRAELLNSTDTLHFDYRYSSGMSANYVPAGNDFPGKPDDPNFRPMTPGITVKDSEGNPISLSSDDVKQFWNGGDKLIVVFGKMTYSDFAGTHKETFCDPQFIMNPGTQRNSTAIEKACANYNRQQNQYQKLPTIDPRPLTASNPLNPINCPVPTQ